MFSKVSLKSNALRRIKAFAVRVYLTKNVAFNQNDRNASRERFFARNISVGGFAVLNE